MSLTETVSSTAIGFGLALATQIIIFPWFGLSVPLHDNIIITLIFTGVSIFRGYFVRRLFNYLHIRIEDDRRARAYADAVFACPHGEKDWDRCPDCCH